MDERRVAFEPTLICQREGIEEMWFTGNHSDIGGSTRRAGIARQWVIDGAVEAGLDFCDTPTAIDVAAPIGVAGRWSRKRDRQVGILVDDKFQADGAVRHPTAK